MNPMANRRRTVTVNLRPDNRSGAAEKSSAFCEPDEIFGPAGISRAGEPERPQDLPERRVKPQVRPKPNSAPSTAATRVWVEGPNAGSPSQPPSGVEGHLRPARRLGYAIDDAADERKAGPRQRRGRQSGQERRGHRRAPARRTSGGDDAAAVAGRS